MCSEKNLSPLSCGNFSAIGNRIAIPMSFAIRLMFESSEWFQQGTTFSHAAGMCFLLLLVILVKNNLLCLMERLHIAVPVKCRLSAISHTTVCEIG